MAKEQSREFQYATQSTGVGACGMVMASNHIALICPVEVLVDKNLTTLIWFRETYQDLVRHEIERVFKKNGHQLPSVPDRYNLVKKVDFKAMYSGTGTIFCWQCNS